MLLLLFPAPSRQFLPFPCPEQPGVDPLPDRTPHLTAADPVKVAVHHRIHPGLEPFKLGQNLDQIPLIIRHLNLPESELQRQPDKPRLRLRTAGQSAPGYHHPPAEKPRLNFDLSSCLHCRQPAPVPLWKRKHPLPVKLSKRPHLKSSIITAQNRSSTTG